MKTRLFNLLTLCILLALPTPALAEQLPIPISPDSATLHAQGKLVSVQVTFTYPVEGSYQLYADVSQTLDSQVIDGSGNEGGSCLAGETETETDSVWIHAGDSRDAFHEGTASGLVMVFMFDESVEHLGVWQEDLQLTE